MQKFSILFLSVIILFAGCESVPAPNVSPFNSPLSRNASPIVTPSAVGEYGENGESVVSPFRIDKPVRVGAKRVTGTGPAGIPIVLADLTFGGQVLAATIIDTNGGFLLKVNDPLPLNHRIGITVGDLTGTGWQREDLDQRFHGDEARVVPQIGFYFDTCLVLE